MACSYGPQGHHDCCSVQVVHSHFPRLVPLLPVARVLAEFMRLMHLTKPSGFSLMHIACICESCYGT